ncbi:MAG: carboxypeptidase-like regulatory domain-containing protein [Acidobacteria bacterium]|nr:carboxypeptidase-like regulatory domain-containing protein [Acidobacteriota bacterium]
MRIIQLLAVLLLSVSVSLAQESRGAILGRVLDPSGAVIAGARLQAQNTATNVVASAVTNQEGNFEIPYLLPGVYRVTAELAGFRKGVRENVEVRVDDRLTVDFTLQVGDVAESVVVSAETPMLDAASASLGSIVDQRRATDLPIQGGNAFALTRLAPGIGVKGGHDQGHPGMAVTGGLMVNGTRGGSSDVTMDGAPNIFRRSAAFGTPVADLVQEFKIQTVTYDASLGHTTGAVVNVSTRTGTNQLHGTTGFFDARWRAVPWFSNRWLWDPTTGPVTPEKRYLADPGYLNQRWSFTLTGPVVLPRVYDGRNRTFFSFGYEGIRVNNREAITATVPTEAQRTGDFSDLLKLGSRYQIYDPATIVPAANGRFSRQPLPGNLIPASRIDPVARNIMGFWPAPNRAGTADGSDNYFNSSNRNWDNRTVMARVDENFSQNHRAFVRFSNHQYNTFNQKIITPAVGTNGDNTGYRLAIDDVYVLSPSTLVNVRYGLTYQTKLSVPISHGFDLLSLGFPQSMLSEIHSKNNPQGIAFPQITVDGIDTLSSDAGNDFADTYHNFGGTVNRMAGNHSMHFGTEVRWMRESNRAFGNVAPRIDFSTAWTRGPLDTSAAAPIGQGFASFLFGLPTGGKIDNNASNAQQSTFWSFFFQDDWKLSRRLTVNLGLRYEYETAITERYNRTIRGFDFQTANPIQAQAQAKYARNPIPDLPASAFQTLGGLQFAGVQGQARGLWNPDRNNFAPRIGFAYQLTNKTVLRGGYGIFYDTMGIDQNSVNQGGFNQATNLIPSLDNGQTFTGTLANPFPNGLIVPPGAAGGLSTLLGQAVTFFNPNAVNPYVQRWSFSVQRELPGRTVFEASYVGNRGAKIGVDRQMNPIPRQYYSTLPVRDQKAIDFVNEQFANPFYGLPEFAGTPLGNQRISRGQFMRPYPEFTSIITSVPAGWSYYHSLQVTAEKRFSGGLSIQAFWTWSKFMEATSYRNDTDPYLEKVISDQDVPQRLTVSAIWELPVGKGKPLLSNAKGLLGGIVSGWQFQTMFEGQSGNPLGFGNAIFNGDLHNVPLPVGERTPERWFNTDAGFDRNAKNQLASNIQMFSSRFAGILSDGVNNFDSSLFKTFRITERVRSQFRFETYNTLNHVQFNDPNTKVTNSAFGSITAEKGSGQRTITLGLKVLF